MWRYYHFTHLHYKWQSYDVCFLRYGAQQAEFLSFWTIFCTFTSLRTSEYQNFEKMKKKPWRYYHFTNVYHKRQSYDVTIIMRYVVQQTEFFAILDHFLFFYPPDNTKNQNFKKLEKNAWRYHHFTQVYQKSWSYAILFLRYGP